MAVTKFLTRKTRLDTIIKYIMNGTTTTLTVNGYDEPVYEETVTLSGNMTVVEVHR